MSSHIANRLVVRSTSVGSGDATRTRDIQPGSTTSPRPAYLVALTGPRHRLSIRTSPQACCHSLGQYASNTHTIISIGQAPEYIRGGMSDPLRQQCKAN